VVQPRHRNHPISLPRWPWRLTAPSRAWRVFPQIFADPWEAFQHAHPRSQPPYYDGLVAKRLAGGNPEKIGDSEDRCLHGGQGKPRGALSCKSALCLRCAKVYVANWVSQVSRMLHAGGLDRHISLTVPALFRTAVYRNAAVGLSTVMRCGAQGLDAFYSAVTGQPLQGGSIVVLPTHGRHGQYHPPLHVRATSGGYEAPGERWEPLQS